VLATPRGLARGDGNNAFIMDCSLQRLQP